MTSSSSSSSSNTSDTTTTGWNRRPQPSMILDTIMQIRKGIASIDSSFIMISNVQHEDPSQHDNTLVFRFAYLLSTTIILLLRRISFKKNKMSVHQQKSILTRQQQQQSTSTSATCDAIWQERKIFWHG